MTPKSKEELEKLDSIRALKKLMADAGIKVGHREQHIDYLLQEFSSSRQQQLEQAVREARIDELRELEALPNVYPEKIRGQYTHVEAIYKSAITNRIAELQSTIKEDKSNG